MRSNVFSVYAPPFVYGPAAANIPSFLGGETPFAFRVSASTINRSKGPIEGLIELYDEDDRWTSRVFGSDVEVVLSNRSAFIPKIYFKSLTIHPLTVRGRWYVSAHH